MTKTFIELCYGVLDLLSSNQQLFRIKERWVQKSFKRIIYEDCLNKLITIVAHYIFHYIFHYILSSIKERSIN